MSNSLVLTPHYLLLNGDEKIGPEIVQYHSTSNFFPLYAFSSRLHYDLFTRNSNMELQPYTLVAKFLDSRIQNATHYEQVLIIDACGPFDDEVKAATFENVYLALIHDNENVEASYHLIRKPDSCLYSVCKENAEHSFSQSGS